MALSTEQVKEAFRRALDSDGTLMGFTKPELQAAFQAADTWADNNATSYNNALPASFRTAATSGQKAMVLAFVCMKRAGAV
jgi:hypothetical protein